MARRPITDRVPCAEPGCPGVSWREYDNQRERARDWSRRQSHPFRCTRHRHPDEVLSGDNPERQCVLVSYQESCGMFWQQEGEQNRMLGSGLLSGPGFKAFAKDFPPGTRLVVTARIEPALGVCVDGEE